MKNEKQIRDKATPSVLEQTPESGDVFEAVNNYGTYNIQPTADTDHMYPTIAQGFNPKNVQTDCENKAVEKRYTKP